MFVNSANYLQTLINRRSLLMKGEGNKVSSWQISNRYKIYSFPLLLISSPNNSTISHNEHANLTNLKNTEIGDFLILSINITIIYTKS